MIAFGVSARVSIPRVLELVVAKTACAIGWFLRMAFDGNDIQIPPPSYTARRHTSNRYRMRMLALCGEFLWVIS